MHLNCSRIIGGRSRKRARSYSACVRARVRASFVGTCVSVCPTSLHPSLGWVASPWHTINTGANLPPMKRTVRWTVGAPKNASLGAKHGQTHTRRPAAIDVCASRRPVEIIMLAETFAPFGRAPTRRRVLHSGRMTHARLRAIPFLRPWGFPDLAVASKTYHTRIVRFRLPGI